MFKQRYQPHVRKNNVIIIDNRLRTLTLVFFITFIALSGLTTFAWSNGILESPLLCAGSLIIAFVLYFGVFGLLERKYVITSNSISVKYGIFEKKIPLQTVTTCLCDSQSFITLSSPDKEIIIDLLNINPNGKQYFFNVLRQNNLCIRQVGSVPKNYRPNTFVTHSFKMSKKLKSYSIFEIVCLIAFMCYISYTNKNSFSIANLDILSIVITLIFIGSVAMVINDISKTISVNGPDIEIKSLLGRKQSFSLSDVTSFHTEVTYKQRKNSSYYIEEVCITLKNTTKITRIDSSFTNYVLFLAYLQDYQIPYAA